MKGAAGDFRRLPTMEAAPVRLSSALGIGETPNDRVRLSEPGLRSPRFYSAAKA